MAVQNKNRQQMLPLFDSVLIQPQNITKGHHFPTGRTLATMNVNIKLFCLNMLLLSILYAKLS